MNHKMDKKGGILALTTIALATAFLSAAPSARQTVIGNDGRLSGAVNGYAWVAAAEGVVVKTPSPCNSSGCFRNTGGKLCTSGTIPALVCSGQGTPQYRCNWDKNWGVVLGMNATQPPGPFGNSAPDSVAVTYQSTAHGGSAGHFRLNAHVVGDPYSRQYCVDNYTPGAPVRPSDMKTECWFGSGQTLSSFSAVDTIGLLRVPENTQKSFDFCITAVTAE